MLHPAFLAPLQGQLFLGGGIVSPCFLYALPMAFFMVFWVTSCFPSAKGDSLWSRLLNYRMCSGEVTLYRSRSTDQKLIKLELMRLLLCTAMRGTSVLYGHCRHMWINCHLVRVPCSYMWDHSFPIKFQFVRVFRKVLSLLLGDYGSHFHVGASTTAI